MTNFMVMTRINVHEAKARLSAYLNRVEAGETVVICRRNRPIAELRPTTKARSEPRPRGFAHGLFVVPDSFSDPLPSDVLDTFEGS